MDVCVKQSNKDYSHIHSMCVVSVLLSLAEV